MNDQFKRSCDLVFLALTVWREARGESDQAKLAVAYSILNRVTRPAWWGRDVQSVVFKMWQYSSLTDRHDRQLTTWPQSNDPSWEACLNASSVALAGSVESNPVPGADSYYDTSIEAPAWTKSARFVAAIGRLRFWDVDRDYEKGP